MNSAETKRHAFGQQKVPLRFEEKNKKYLEERIGPLDVHN